MERHDGSECSTLMMVPVLILVTAFFSPRGGYHISCTGRVVLTELSKVVRSLKPLLRVVLKVLLITFVLGQLSIVLYSPKPP